MRFTFLGTGTSAGVPAIACSCAVCTSADPRDQRLRTGAAVRFTDPGVGGVERCVLLDATPDLRQQALRAGLTRCDAILFTHNHVDHTFGLDEVRRFNAVQRSPIDVYAEPHTLEALRRVYLHIFDADKNVNDSFVATLIPHVMEIEKPIDLFGVRFTPLRFHHGRLPIAGFRIEYEDRSRHSSVFPLVYATDVSAVPPQTLRHLRGLKTLVIDALRHRHHPTHLTLAQAISIAENAGASSTWFVHMSHDLGHEETNATLPPHMRLAHDGLTLDDAETRVD